MAKTAYATSDNLTKKAWEEKLYRDAVKTSYFMDRFAGDTPDALINVKTDLTKDQGDKITMGIRMRLAGAGVTSGTILEGNEEKLTTYNTSVSLEQYRNAVRDNGALDRQRVMFDLDKESKMALQDWGGEKIDQLCFDAILNAPTKIAYRESSAGVFTVTGTAATAKTAMNLTYKPNAAFLTALTTYAKTGGNRTVIPLRPVKVSGKNYYVLLMHPDNVYDLKQDPIIQASWQNAANRGDDNPLFKDAEIVWNGLIVHSHENIPIAADGGGGTITYSRCVLMGAQALVWAWGQRGKIVEAEFDYENEHGYSWSMIAGVVKPVFNSLDYGSISVYAARSPISA